MTERIQIVVEAKDAASGILRSISSSFGALGSGIQELTAMNINWGNVAEQAGRMVVDALKASIEATTKYAAEVRDLSLISGQTAEESSRMLQVLDDYEISAQDVTTAVRAMTREGFAPTIETIARLSDEYRKLGSEQEKNEFILKNLGRSGLEWVNMLNQGGDAIRKMSEGVNENLILNREQIKASEEYRLALDAWNDEVQALKVGIGTGLLPVLTSLLDTMNKNREAARLSFEIYGTSRRNITKDQRDALWEQVNATEAATESTKDLTSAIATGDTWWEKSTMQKMQEEAALIALTEAQKAQTAYEKEELGLIQGLQNVYEDYTMTMEEITVRRAEINQQLAEGKIKTKEATEELGKLAEAERAAGEAAREASEKFVFSLLSQKLAAEGNYAAILDIGVAWGQLDADVSAAGQNILKVLDDQTLSWETKQDLIKQYSDSMLGIGDDAAKMGADVKKATTPIITSADAAKKKFEELGSGIVESNTTMKVVGQEFPIAMDPMMNSLMEAKQEAALLVGDIGRLKQQEGTYDYWINIHVNGALPDFSMLDLLNTNTCFSGDTLISMPEGEKPIRDMAEGDEVLTYDRESGKNVKAKVKQVFHHGADEGGNYHLLINGLLRVTPNHPIYRGGEWVEAGDLRIGDMLKTFGGETAVISIRKIYKRIPTYNLEVDHPAHNYYAGRVLVHNKEAKAGGGPVYAGTPYVVGERGPEVFTPQTNGTITPNEGMQFNNFYGPVTLTVSEESIGDLMGVQ